MTEVDSKLVKDGKVLWAPWDEVLAYHDWVSRKAHEVSSQGYVPTIAQLSAADRVHRLYVLDLVRNQKYPLGESFQVVRIECAHGWTFFTAGGTTSQYKPKSQSAHKHTCPVLEASAREAVPNQ